MTNSDDFGIDDDDTEFLAAATQAEASQHGAAFAPSPRPTKRRRLRRGPRQMDGADSDDLEWSETDDEAHSSPKQSQPQPTEASAVGGDEIDGTDLNYYYFPGEVEGYMRAVQKNSKYKIRTGNDGQFKDMIFTQTQVGLDSSPGRFRGAVWKKPKPPPPPPGFDAPTKSLQAPQVDSRDPKRAPVLKQTALNGMFRPNTSDRAGGIEDDARLAARLQAEEDALARKQQGRNTSSGEPSTQIHEELADLPSDAFSSSSPEKSPSKEVIELSSQVMASQVQPQRLRGPQTGLKQMTIFGQAATQELTASQATKKKHAWPLMEREEPPTHHKLDEKAMETWVYPTNLGSIRDYQYNIVTRSLYRNTLVALPTGLGKTFIAATVMLNYYRWTKNAQIVFMAPTKPLIAQQMDACYHIVGIPRHDTVLMTGETTPAVRADEWLEKRVFFMTPQTVINDLKTGICDPKKLVLVVVDEAHKATGSYAYTEVIAFLDRFNTSFRVLALTATPGSTVEAVQAVIDHLGIAHVELRTEQSLDIRPYTHEKDIEKEVFDYSDEQVMVMELLSKALKPQLDKLNQHNGYWSRDPMQLTAYGLTQARQKWAQSDAGRKAPMPVKGIVNAAFTALSQMAHSIGLLKNHGIGPFYTNVLEFQKTAKESKGKTARAIIEHPEFVKMADRIRSWTANADFIGHPKLQYLRELVLNHFLDAAEGAQGPDVPPSATRVMIFASYRDSTEEIVRVLKRNEPLIRPHVFVGQAASSSSEGMNQKKQNAVIQDFKAGKFNTLVATSIGEEGLDIGTVDLIVCYDASASPIRMLQRIGRTGRKRLGKVTLLLMRGKEENDYAKAQDNYTYIQQTIADDSKYSYRDDQSPRILPRGIRPVVDKRVIEIPIENSQPIDLNEKGRRAKGKGKTKRPPKKFHMPDGVRTGFTTAAKLGISDDEDDETAKPAPKKKTPAKRTPAKAKKRPASPPPEPAPVPFLQDVLLTTAQQSELERKYARTADDEDNIIHAPDATKFPSAARNLGPTKYIHHGKASASVSKALLAMQAIDNDKIEMMKTFDDKLLKTAGPAKVRLVSPEASAAEEDLLAVPVSAPKAKKPRGRPRKKNVVERVPSNASAATDGGGSAPKKPRGRQKKNAKQRVYAHGSDAMEGDDSEPEPTPADMRIGTQGIDLGSRDTSGEEEDEEPDSELDAFIARSDEVIETVSSSLPASPEAKGRGLVRKGALGPGKGKKAAAIEIDSDEKEQLPGHESDGDSDATLTKAVPASRLKKKRNVVDSDSE
jgi:ATP-dependent DNA helicase MPH1